MDFSSSRLSRLCDAVKNVIIKDDLPADLDQLLEDPNKRGPFLEQLTAELTVGESFFFRNEHHFKALREQVIPDILRKNADRRDIRVWSAGCAAGEEPYSLAILIDQLLSSANHQLDPNAKKETGPICAQHPEGRSGKLDPSPFSQNQKFDDWQASILGTDINTEFLRRAREAEYREWSFRRTEIHRDPRYFAQTGDKFRLLPHLRERVRFVYLNLVKDVYPFPLTGTAGLDLILFRNVAIYLQAEVVQEIIRHFHRCLHPGGWLLLGEAEVSHMRPEQFDVRRFGSATFFQKPPLQATASLPDEPPRPVLPIDYGSERATGAASAPRAEKPAANVEKAAREVKAIARPSKSLGKHARTSKASAAIRTERFDWQQVEQHITRENFAAAESALDTIRDRVERATMRSKYVRRLLDLSQLARANEMLDTCLEEEPLLIDGHLLKASLAEERGDLKEAEAACRRALYVQHDCAMAHLHLALVQQQTGDAAGSKKSLRLVQKLAESRDENTLVEHGDGICYGRLSELARSMLES